MNRILSAASAGVLGAAGVFGAAAAFTTISMTTAAPAMADAGCVPDIVCDVIDEARALPNSIAQQPDRFLNGDGGDHVGILNQPQEFVTNLQGQPQRFVDSINPATAADRFLNGNCTTPPLGCEEGEHVGLLNQPAEFANNLAGQPQRFADSISRSIGAFGADVGPDGDDGPGGTG